jgi:hypothetical protein
LLRSRHWWLTMSEHCTALFSSTSSPYTLPSHSPLSCQASHRSLHPLNTSAWPQSASNGHAPQLLDDLVVQEARLVDHLAHQLFLRIPQGPVRHAHRSGYHTLPRRTLNGGSQSLRCSSRRSSFPFAFNAIFPAKKSELHELSNINVNCHISNRYSL